MDKDRAARDAKTNPSRLEIGIGIALLIVSLLGIAANLLGE